MEKCLYNGKVLYAYEVLRNFEFEQKIRKCPALTCYDCGASVFFRHGKQRTECFVHRHREECRYGDYCKKQSDIFKYVQREFATPLQRIAANRGFQLEEDAVVLPEHYTAFVLRGSSISYAIDIIDYVATAVTLEKRKKLYEQLGYRYLQVTVDKDTERESFFERDMAYFPVKFALNHSLNNTAVVIDKEYREWSIYILDKTKLSEEGYNIPVWLFNDTLAMMISLDDIDIDDEEKQLSFTDFNQPQGLQMNPENRWVKKAEMIPWDTIEKEYAKLFPSKTGMPAKPLRMALGSLLIQKQYHYPDEELVEQIRENPYYQYFIGMPGYEDKIPFVPSLLVAFRKRLSEDVLNEINEMIIEYNAQKSDDDDSDGGDNNDCNNTDDTSDSSANSGTLILDATCAPQNIKYPQDIELLNETREKLEDMLCRISDEYGFYRPRMYKKNARKDYLALAKCRKRGAKKIRKAIKKQLQYIRRDLGYMDNLLENNNVILSTSDSELLDILTTVYEQQRYMFENNTHTVENRIVSISQPYIRPIVRGKAKSPVEFGAKLDLSVDEIGMCRLEKLSFDAYNESAVLKTAIENYKQRTGHYPERVLVDQIYRNRENISFCNSLCIRISGKKLGRPKKDVDTKAEKKTAYQDNTDRIEVERKFSLAKRKFGLGLLLTKREDTTKASIVLSIIAMNVDRLAALLLRLFEFVLPFFNFGVQNRDVLEMTGC